jgi:hypothetical protein
MYAAGIPVLIKLLMGHAGSSLVHTYAKVDDDFKRYAAARLEAFMASKDFCRKHINNRLRAGRDALFVLRATGIQSR